MITIYMKNPFPDHKIPKNYQMLTLLFLVVFGISCNSTNDGKTTLANLIIDKTPVTVADFRTFVQETDYQTEAEIIGNAVVFDRDTNNWILVNGATWAYPFGPDFDPAADDHPVTQVSYNDANAYLAWSGKRLLTPEEFKLAARGNRPENDRYPWGNQLIVDGEPKANTLHDVDSFIYTSPVGYFGTNDLGLADISGNVWEWTSDGVLMGGSFMCDSTYCHGFKIGEVSNTTLDNASFHIGFRGVSEKK